MSSIQLWPKQQEAFEFARGKTAVALLCEQRTGKTYISMRLIEDWAENFEVCGLIIGLLNNKESTWIDSMKKFLPKIRTFTDFTEFKAHRGHKVLLVHFESLPRVIKQLVRYKKFNLAIIDEAHRIANRGSKQSRAAARLWWIRVRIILTGTPMEKQPVDFFAQFRFLDPQVFGLNWSNFESKWMDFPVLDMSHVRHGTVAWEKRILRQRILRNKAEFREEKRPEFVALLQPFCYRLTREDVGIKAPTVELIEVPMTGQQLRVYQEMDEDGVALLPDGTELIAQMEITRIMKRRQIASGFVYDEDGELHHLGNAKMAKLMAMVRELTKPIVIFTAFTPDTDRIYDLLLRQGYDAMRVYGATKKKLRPDIWRNFQKGKFDVIVCQIKTGGVGVDLWKANNAIVHSMGHSYIDWSQAQARLDSRDKNKATRIWVLCSKDTIDHELYDLVLVKHWNSSKTLNHLKRRYRDGKTCNHEARGRSQGKAR